MLNLSFVNNNPPALNAQNMNAIVSGINTISTQLTSPFNFKGAVADMAALEAINNPDQNDTYYVDALMCRYTWTGSDWEQSSLNETDYEDNLDELQNELDTILVEPNIKWNIGQNINGSGVISSSAYTALTDIIPVQTGDKITNLTPGKDSNNVYFIMYIVYYNSDGFYSRVGFGTNATETIAEGIVGVRFLFGRLSSSQVPFNASDFGYWNCKYLLKPASYASSLAIKPIPGVAVQVSATDGCMSVSATISGNNATYTLNDNTPGTYWYCGFLCNGELYQITNNSNYSANKVVVVSSVTGTFNKYKGVSLVIDTINLSLAFKETEDMTYSDCALQLYCTGINQTPWFSSAFSTSNKKTVSTDKTLVESNEAADSQSVGNAIKFPGNIMLQVGNNVTNKLSMSVSGSGTLTYTLNDADSGNSWAEMFACHGERYQLTNDTNYTPQNAVYFQQVTLSVANWRPVFVCINTDTLTLALKTDGSLLPTDGVIAVFFNGDNTTVWDVPIFVQKGRNSVVIQKESSLNKNLYKVFKKIGCIGDSWTAGYVKNLDTSVVHGKSVGYSWPDYMAGDDRTWVNGGYSGSNTRTYLTDNDPNLGGGHTAIENAGVCQAYTIGLGINDSNPDVSLNVPVGTVADIGTSADTFYANYCTIIDWARNISPDAFVFCFTMYPQTSTLASRYSPYNTAIRNIVSYYNDTKVILLDLANRGDIFNDVALSDDLINNHHGCVGWAIISGALQIIFNEKIGENPLLFHDVRDLPTS